MYLPQDKHISVLSYAQTPTFSSQISQSLFSRSFLGLCILWGCLKCIWDGVFHSSFGLGSKSSRNLIVSGLCWSNGRPKVQT
jgi:hypothetical protein